MGIAFGMKELTRNIASSRKERRQRISEIGKEANEVRGEARDMIESFEDSRRETNRQLRQNLAQDNARRRSEATGVLREAQNILKDFKASRKEASTRLRTELIEGTAERREEVNRALGDAKKLIRGFHIFRQNLSSGLRKNLRRNVAIARGELAKLLGNARSLVNSFQASRGETGSQLKKDLAQSRANIKSGVKRMLGDFTRAQRDIRADMSEARVAWQGLTSIGQEKTEKAENSPEVEAPTAEGETREEEMLSVIDKHPEGINLAGIAERLGVAPVVLGKTSKSLQDKGGVRKEGKLYFPVDGKEETGQGFHFRPPLR